MTATAPEYTSANIWDEWYPESALADVLAGRDVVADIGQVRGAWKRRLQKEIKAGRIVKWRGKWFPEAGHHFGLGPDKDCYGTPALRDHYAACNRPPQEAVRTIVDDLLAIDGAPLPVEAVA